jgi:hypothetical protein
MISIFNGRKRTLGGSTSEIYAQVSVDFRKYLHYLKGAKLSVFLAISLHTDADGWAWPSRELLAWETGYNVRTISAVLTELCQLTINGQRLLLRYQPTTGDRQFTSNHYLIFPSPEECARYESTPPFLGDIRSPCEGNPRAEKPHAEKPRAENLPTKENQPKEETREKNNQKDEEEPVVLCPIHKVPMRVCEANDGTQDTWYAHKLRDGTWCKPALPQERQGYTREYCEKWGIVY